VERVGASAPPSQEEGQADGLDNLGGSTNGDGLGGALLGEELAEV